MRLRSPGTIREARARAHRATDRKAQDAWPKIASVVPAAAESWLVDASRRTERRRHRRLPADRPARVVTTARFAYRHELDLPRGRGVRCRRPTGADLHVTVLRTLGERGDIAPARLSRITPLAPRMRRAVLVYAQAAAERCGRRRRASRGRLALMRPRSNMPRELVPRQRAEPCRNALSYENYLTGARRAGTRGAPRARSQSGNPPATRCDRVTTCAGCRGSAGSVVNGPIASAMPREAIATLERFAFRGASLRWRTAIARSSEMLAHRAMIPSRGPRARSELAERLGDIEVQTHALNNRGTATMLDGNATTVSRTS